MSLFSTTATPCLPRYYAKHSGRGEAPPASTLTPLAFALAALCRLTDARRSARPLPEPSRPDSPSPTDIQYPRPCRRRRRARCSRAERLSRPGEQQNQNPRTRQANRAPGSLVGESPEAVVCASSLAHLLSLHSASSPWLAVSTARWNRPRRLLGNASLLLGCLQAVWES